ncbi:TonB-dependent receptor plug domain-containing protein [Nitrosophilus labii]|uniref:TonB-dependent receptor plug domain-containing protein n=1 Tax=Nitrosophilus labii TaxID=2706014 RepID=UPI001656D07A|nr:TonB-dependent receptor plug domain-containing protein [Nitrosophilus labii]
MKYIPFFFIITLSLFSQNLDSLLEQYKKESELSKITKIDTAGFVYIYTREDLEYMQAYSLKDILKTIPGLNYTIAPNGLYLFTAASTSYIPPSAVRLYINDHDLSSASFGSALLIWGDMPVEFIDHIEVYRATSSIEFGNEAGVIIIKVYTKLAQREEGKKVRVITDSFGSAGIDTYIANTYFDNSSLFLYLHGKDINSKTYHNDGFDIKKDENDYLFYTKYSLKDFSLEAASFKQDKAPFLGNGALYHPTGGGLDARHTYIKIDKKIKGIEFDISYDSLDYDRVYEDESKIYTSLGYVDRYQIKFKDTIFSLIWKKFFTTDKNSLLIGGFYKYKGFQAEGKFDDKSTKFDNHLNLYSLYAENSYRVSENSSLIFSIKGDFYRYGKEVDSKNKLISRIGFIKEIGKLKLKTFFTKTYTPPQFYTFYSKENYPLITNPHLKYPQAIISTIGADYYDNKYKLGVKLGNRVLKDKILYDPFYGYFNINDKVKFNFIEINYEYFLDDNDRLLIYITKGENSKDNLSPNLHINLRVFNKFNKFDIYNEFLYKNSYEYYGMHVKSSLDYTVSLKYHISKDLSIGIRGENILNNGFEQAYRKTNNTYPLTDHRFIINLEYLF